MDKLLDFKMDSISLLPDEVILVIFASLDNLDNLSLIKCRQVSKRFKKFSEDYETLQKAQDSVVPAQILQFEQLSKGNPQPISICTCKVCASNVKNGCN